eukprot:m.140126 g.140126  ORF g.140126 m.140126 type:complete len:174 (+) comp15958_c5_seq8:3152-3673(+)
MSTRIIATSYAHFKQGLHEAKRKLPNQPFECDVSKQFEWLSDIDRKEKKEKKNHKRTSEEQFTLLYFFSGAFCCPARFACSLCFQYSFMKRVISEDCFGLCSTSGGFCKSSSVMSHPYSCELVIGILYFCLGGIFPLVTASNKDDSFADENSEGTVRFGLSARQSGVRWGLIV